MKTTFSACFSVSQSFLISFNRSQLKDETMRKMCSGDATFEWLLWIFLLANASTCTYATWKCLTYSSTLYGEINYAVLAEIMKLSEEETMSLASNGAQITSQTSLVTLELTSNMKVFLCDHQKEWLTKWPVHWTCLLNTKWTTLLSIYRQ